MKCLEEKDKYLLVVRWKSLVDHRVHFRNSEEYQKWKGLLHHFYHPFPVVEYYETVILPG